MTIHTNQTPDKLISANKELALLVEEKEKQLAELNLANQELADLNTKQQILFASIVNSSNDAILSKTMDGIITSWNQGAEKIFGYSRNEIMGKPISMLIPPHLQQEEDIITYKIRKGENLNYYQTERIKKDGSVFPVSLTVSPIKDTYGNITGMSKILRDNTATKEAEQKLIKSNRMYAFISSINQMIVRATSETSLFQEACRIAIDIGNFRMAWVGLIDPQTKKVMPVVHIGEERRYLSNIKTISIDDGVPEGRGPTGTALREGKTIFCNDIENNESMAPWKAEATSRGYLSSIALPIKKFGQVVGSYTLYAPVKNFFDREEITLLEEAAGNISFTLENFEKAAQHKSVQEEIVRSNTQLTLAQEIAHVGYWEIDLINQSNYWSDELYKLFGIEKNGQVMPLETFMSHVYAEDREPLSESYRQSLENSQPLNTEFRFMHPDGMIRYYHVKGNITAGENRKPVRLQGTTQDITERKKSEEATKANEQKLELIYNTTRDVIFLISVEDNRYRFTSVNQAFLSVTGLTKEQVSGRFVDQVIPEPSLSLVLQNYSRAIAARQTVQWEEITQYPMGTKTGIVSITPVFDNHNNCTMLVGSVHDITESKLAAEKIKDSEERYRSIFENSSEAIFLTKPDGSILSANPEACRIFGMSEEEIRIAGRNNVVNTNDLRLAPALAERLRTGRFKGELSFIRKDGTEFPGEITSTIFTSFSGEQRISSIIKDISERKAAEEKIRQSEEKYRHIFEFNKDPLFLVDVETRLLVDANPATCQLYGYSKEELLRLKNTDISAEPEKTLESMHSKEATVQLRYHRKKDGTVFPLELTLAYLRMNDRDTVIVAIRDITERVEASRKLEEEKQRLELALWGADLGMWDWHIPSGNMIFNERWAHMLGYQPEEIRPHVDSWKDLVHPDDLLPVSQVLEEHMAGRSVNYRSEYRIKCKKGEWKWIMDSGRVITRDAAGNPLRMVGTHLDISVRKQLELENSKLATVAQKTNNAVIITNADGIIEWVNEGFTHITGYTFAEAIGQKPGDLLQGHDTDPLAIQKMREAFISHESIELEVKNYTKDRIPCWLFLSIQPVFDDNGVLRHFIAIETDITERVKASLKLEEEKQRLELALLGGDLGLWDWSVQTGYFVTNERCATMLGYQLQELPPHVDTWWKLVHPEDVPKIVRLLQLQLDGHSFIYQSENRVKCKDGSWKWVLDSGKVIKRDAEGKPLRVVGIHLDITERKLYEEKMQHLNEELEHRVAERTLQLNAVNKELEAFSYSVSHDLRAPLRGIDGFSKALLEDYEQIIDEEGKDFLHSIREATLKMGHLIDDMLSLSRISRSELSIERVNIHELATSILADLQKEHPERKVKAVIQADLYVQADMKLMRIALQNLLSNAWKYTSKKEEALIEVGTLTKENKQTFYIRDNGAGFNMAYAHKLFGAFQRLHRQEEFEGTGIGLATVKRIITLHGGSIWAESELNRGTTFFFTLQADYR